MESLQVIAAPRRLRILELVWDRELSAGDIAAVVLTQLSYFR